MTTRPSRRTTTAMSATAAALLLALAGCSSANGAAAPLPRPSGSPAATTPSATASPTPSPTAQAAVTPEEQAGAQAEAAVRRYYAVINELGTNSTSDPLPALKQVMVSTGLLEAHKQVLLDRERQRRQVGETTIVSLVARAVDLTNTPTSQPPIVPIVQVDVCYDVSGVDVVDAAGNSVVSADRVDRALEQLRVANYNYPDPAGWKVLETTVKNDPCSDVS